MNREELYRKGGLFSVTSKILVHDFLREYSNLFDSRSSDQRLMVMASGGTVPAKLITGLVILHAEK